MDELTSTTGLVALGAGLAALIALVLALILTMRMRRMRAAQAAVLGGHGAQDLVAYVQHVGEGFTDLREWVEEALARLDGRMNDASERIDGCVAYTAMVRYDAYGEMSGHQSSSMALLDSHKTGIVFSSIVHRDQARVYVKQIDEGVPSLELSPEEQQAVDNALTPAAAPSAA